ncbi:MAG: hypothetical protein Q7S70_00120 [bacterium]|nr:hypothetical protein [bacterium]
MRKFLSILITAFIPLFVLAADPVNIQNPLGTISFEVVIEKIINFIFRISVVLAPLMIVIGGVMFVTSGGNLQKTDQAKKLMIWTAAGFLIIIMAKGFVSLIKELLGS